MIRTSRRLLSVALIIATMIPATSCFGASRTSPIAPAEVDVRLGEYDAEELDPEEDDIAEYLSNERALLAGFYMNAVGNREISRLLKNDELNASYSVIPGLYSSLLSPDISNAVLMVKKEDGEDREAMELTLFAAEFETSDKASDYVRSCDIYCDELWEDEDVSQDGGGDIKHKFFTMSWRRNVVAMCLYAEDNYVMFLSGHAYKRDDLNEALNELCGAIGVEAPDVSNYGSNEEVPAEIRMDVLKDELDPVTIDDDEFEFKWQLDEPGTFYVSSDDDPPTSSTMDEDMLEIYDHAQGYEVIFSIDSHTSNLRAMRYAVMRIDFGTEDMAQGFYDSMNREVTTRTKHKLEVIETRDNGSTRYTLYDLADPYMSASYAVACDGRYGYILSFLNMDNEEAREKFYATADLMGLA